MSTEGINVNDVIDPATGLPLKFPNSCALAHARAQEFRRLSPDERWKQIAELMEIGMNMVHASPRRAAIERRMEAQEAEWKRLQQRVFSQYGA
jgi:phosphosulfolactate synthase (CoM biosynthesis protein A)